MQSKDEYTRSEDKRFTLRIDKKLFKLLEESAAKDKRSIGRQIEFIVEQYFQDKNAE